MQPPIKGQQSDAAYKFTKFRIRASLTVKQILQKQDSRFLPKILPIVEIPAHLSIYTLTAVINTQK
jgi:hypothetical protein